MRLLPTGRDALLVEVGSTSEAIALATAGRGWARDVVPAARTVLFDGVPDVAALERRLREVDLGSPPARGAGATIDDVVEVPTVYDGPDLVEVARQWQVTVEEVVALHTATLFTVAFCGFAPGFAYCTGLRRTVGRRAEPRARVPAGAVGVAGEFTAVYPTASPGGWQLLGRTDLHLWDLRRDPPATLAPGRRVRFVAVAGPGEQR